MLKESELNRIQDKLGYQFRNKRLLRQAFTRRSFAVCNGGADNEVLEFYGDRILEFAVIKDFCELHGRINNKDEFVSSKTVGELSREDSNLVKNVHLAEQISRLSLTRYLQVEKSSEKSIMKVKADLFEAILGAVALDSNWNLQRISEVFHAMMYSREEINELTCSSEEYIDLFGTEIWKRNVFKTESRYTKCGGGYTCSFWMDFNGHFVNVHAYGDTQHLARIKASEKGYMLLMLLAEGKFIDGMGYSEQLYLLYSCGILSEPRFRFEFYPVDSENPSDVWRCFGGLCDSDTEFESEATTQFDAKEQVSYAILCDALGIEPVEFELEEQSDGMPGQTVPHSAGMHSPGSACTDNIIVLHTAATYEHGQGLLKYILSHYEKTA